MSENFVYTNKKGNTYYLNTKTVNLKSGRVQQIYFFSKDSRDTACVMPAGYEVSESARTGMPFLKKSK